MKYLIILLLAFCGMFHSVYGWEVSEDQIATKKAYDCINMDIPKCRKALFLCRGQSTAVEPDVDYIHELDCLNQWKGCLDEIFEGCQLNLG